MLRSILALMLMAATSSQAGAATAIVCKYPSGDATVFQGAGTIDITDPYHTGATEGTVPLLVNGEGPFNYSLSVGPSRIGTWFTYSIKGEFFINDIKIRYLQPFPDTMTGEFADGTHRTDYQTVELSCVVKR